MNKKTGAAYAKVSGHESGWFTRGSEVLRMPGRMMTAE